jgi:folate-dependent phosphoribosylglycinamide formyltransferase PurN
MNSESKRIKPISVVVLSCGTLGYDVANTIVDIEGVESVTLVNAPYRTKKRGWFGKLRHAWRMEGPFATVRAIGRRIAGRRSRSKPLAQQPLDSRIRHLAFPDFHDPQCIDALKAASVDLGVIAGTYILRQDVFAIPRLGSINLHSGKVPEYRGAAPAFWELYNGETEVGITIHEVVQEVDSGRVLRQECFPIDPAPAGDPLDYVERYRHEILRPNGIRLLAETVSAIATGREAPVPQDLAQARTYRSPDYAAKRELRRRVARRRRKEV